ncbi:hypothetical protein [Embleya hyalina]|uniref:Uncharacterized protein n=1 Tax=Embleya hyalina TaxID=516124 RepID=A0A401Z714_9ACTN|nr:hypothetical protein [Embleya hyalina]GCE02606.1 hypothetical protein EHYA_10383 [Embleya hyalina]
MGWSSRQAFEPDVIFEAVIADGVIRPAYTDDDGVLWIEDEDLWVVVDGAIVDGVIHDAHVDDDGRIWIDMDDD